MQSAFIDLVFLSLNFFDRMNFHVEDAVKTDRVRKDLVRVDPTNL